MTVLKSLFLAPADRRHTAWKECLGTSVVAMVGNGVGMEEACEGRQEEKANGSSSEPVG